MPVTISHLLEHLGRLAPWDKAGGWDPVGLQLGDPARTARSVAVVHEITEAAVDRLVAEPVDLVVAYHPLLFQPTTRLVSGRSATGRAFRLVEAGVALAVVHTAFDVAPGGAADALATALDLGEPRPFGPSWGPDTVTVVTFVPPPSTAAVTAAMAGAGAGTIGNYSACSFRSGGEGSYTAGESTDPTIGEAGSTHRTAEDRVEMVAPKRSLDAVVAALVGAHPYEEPAYTVYESRGNAGFIGRQGRLEQPRTLAAFAAVVESVLGGVIRVGGDLDRRIETVGVVPGSGGSFLGSVTGCDAVVTGDVTHHVARQALDRGLAVIDPGHAATERPGISRLYAAISQIVDAPVDLTDLAADPWEPAWKR